MYTITEVSSGTASVSTIGFNNQFVINLRENISYNFSLNLRAANAGIDATVFLCKSPLTTLPAYDDPNILCVMFVPANSLYNACFSGVLPLNKLSKNANTYPLYISVYTTILLPYTYDYSLSMLEAL